MRIIFEFFLAAFLRMVLWFRYKIKVTGLEKLNPQTLNKPGGVLFLPNHPAVFVDATSVTIALWPKYRMRPLIVEYMYYVPVVHWVMRMLNALPVPNFGTSSNSLKRKRNEEVTQAVINGLKVKENFLIFPAGRCKSNSHEALDGASAVHRIVQESPDVNVVLVRVKGLWGSRFSRALTGQTPAFFPVVFWGIKKVLQNLLFFTPRREVIIEFEPAPADFPYQANRLDFNRYLEHWYNQPDGLTQQKGDSPGDSLVLVTYSRWRDEYPVVWEQTMAHEEIEAAKIPEDVRKKVINKIVELTNAKPDSITPQTTLTTDLGMDSLDIAELTAFLQDQFDISGVPGEDLTTVGRLMGIASKQIVCKETKEEETQDISKWDRQTEHKRVRISEGDTIPEVFLNTCSKMGHAVACGDMRSGVLTYAQLKLFAMVLAEYIRKIPGEYVGIMLPASVPATTCIIACQLAGKVPLMVNWTVGTRHLQAVADLSKVQVVLSSWAFLDRLQNVELTPIEDRLVMLEDVRRKLGIFKKLKAAMLSKLSNKMILKAYNTDSLTPESKAVLLFTSGTESLPKGVPLTYKNILSNQRAALDAIEVFADDIMLGILPPFHSFGFTITSLIFLLAGARVAFSPDPTDGRRMADAFERWRCTIICGAPTFIKAMLKAARPEQLRTMRLCITGAEKLPPELVQGVIQIGKGETLLEGYGITECAPILTFTLQGKSRKGVGHPLPGVELLIVDLVEHKPVPNGTQGLILARGPNVFTKYLNPGLSSPFITVNGQQWYVTGDLGYLDEEGSLILSGRLKRFIKVGGEMVSLASIEEALNHFALNKGWITAKEEAPSLAICAKELPGEKPKISLFCTFGTSLDDVNKALKDAGFSNLVKVANITQIKEMPLMGTGKINYRKLEEADGPKN